MLQIFFVFLVLLVLYIHGEGSIFNNHNDTSDYTYFKNLLHVLQSKHDTNDNIAIFHAKIQPILETLWYILIDSISIVPIQDNLEEKLRLCTKFFFNFTYDQHSSELWIPNMLRFHHNTSQFLRNATSITKPLFYYIEAYPQLSVMCTHETSGRWNVMEVYQKELLLRLKKMEAFENTLGNDFVLCGSHPNVPFKMFSMQNFNAQIMSHITWLTVDFDINGAYPRDIIIPYFTPPINTTWNTGSTRDILVSAGFNAKSFSRAKILEAFKTLQENVSDIKVNHKLSDEQFHQTMYRSEFCLHARGDTTSSQRLFLIINTNCIPIIISDNSILPFESLIDYSLFSVKVEEAFVINDVHEFVSFLRAIPMQKRVEMRKKLNVVKEIFSFYSANRFNAVSMLFMDLLVSKIKLCAQIENNEVETSHMSMCVKLSKHVQQKVGISLIDLRSKLVS
jgi:hypothetical protein